MALMAADAADRVEQLTALTERLTELIALEAEAFERRRPHEAAGYIDETARLANLYRHESARVRRDPGMVAAAPTEQRQHLLSATKAFDAVLARQGRALESAKSVTEGLVRAIAEEVASRRGAPSGYGPGAATASATAITLNQRA